MRQVHESRHFFVMLDLSSAGCRQGKLNQCPPLKLTASPARQCGRGKDDDGFHARMCLTGVRNGWKPAPVAAILSERDFVRALVVGDDCRVSFVIEAPDAETARLLETRPCRCRSRREVPSWRFRR